MTDFFDRFERQLVQAGKRLAQPAPRRHRRLLGPPAVIVGLALVLGGVSTAAVVRDSPSEKFHRLVEQNDTAGGEDPYAMARALGVDPANAIKVRRGLVFSLAESGDITCLVHTAGLDTCSTTAEVAAGQGIQVQADCSTKGPRPHLMQIRGLLPQEVAELRVGYSDGSVRRARVVQGAVWLEAKTPKAGGPFPTTEIWVGAAGQILRDAPFPFDGKGLCIPVPERPSARR